MAQQLEHWQYSQRTLIPFLTPACNSPFVLIQVPGISSLLLPSVGTVHRHMQAKHYIIKDFLRLEKRKNEILYSDVLTLRQTASQV